MPPPMVNIRTSRHMRSEVAFRPRSRRPPISLDCARALSRRPRTTFARRMAARSRNLEPSPARQRRAATDRSIHPVEADAKTLAADWEIWGQRLRDVLRRRLNRPFCSGANGSFGNRASVHNKPPNKNKARTPKGPRGSPKGELSDFREHTPDSCVTQRSLCDSRRPSPRSFSSTKNQKDMTGQAATDR